MRYEPMLLRETDRLPQAGAWGYEVKFDGFRTVGEVEPSGHVTLLSKTGVNDTDRYPAVAEQLPLALGDHAAVVDGEMVGIDALGRHSRRELSRGRHARAVYFIFDLLELDQEPLTSRTFVQRRLMLEGLLVPQPAISLSEVHFDADTLMHGVYEQRMEGIVMKRLNSRYLPGRRSNSWLKLKFRYPSESDESSTELY